MTDSAAAAARFLTRNAVDALPAGELERQLASGRPLRVKLGVDPTTPDIHLGHTVVLTKLREFQELGHTVVLIIGDYTARVGDPSGRSSTRPQADPEEIDRNAETYEAQAFKVLDRARTEVRHNSEWLDMPMEELFRLARTSTVNVLLARDVQQAYGVEPQSILTMPILPGTDGVQKMSKSLDNYVGVDEPPKEVYGKLMRVPDVAMPTYYDLLLDGPPDPSLPPRDAKRALARALTARFHGEEAAQAAEERFETLHVRRELPEEVEEFAFAGDDGTVHVPALLADAFGISRSEGRRLLAQSGVRLDGRAIGEKELDMRVEELDGAVIQLGKRRFKRLRRR